jgi:hypothetical protein
MQSHIAFAFSYDTANARNCVLELRNAKASGDRQNKNLAN